MFSRRSTSASLPSQSFWGKFKKKGDKESEFRERQAQMALARQRLLTLAYDEMETVRVVRISFALVLLITLSSFRHSCPVVSQ